jgi:hypothetical protein
MSYALAPRVLRLLLARITDFAEPVGEARRGERFFRTRWQKADVRCESLRYSSLRPATRTPQPSRERRCCRLGCGWHSGEIFGSLSKQKRDRGSFADEPVIAPTSLPPLRLRSGSRAILPEPDWQLGCWLSTNEPLAHRWTGLGKTNLGIAMAMQIGNALG